MGQEGDLGKEKDVLGDNITRHSSESICKDVAAHSTQRQPTSSPPVATGIPAPVSTVTCTHLPRQALRNRPGGAHTLGLSRAHSAAVAPPYPYQRLLPDTQENPSSCRALNDLPATSASRN